MCWVALATVCKPKEGGEDLMTLPRACGGEEEGAGILRSLAESESTLGGWCWHTNPRLSASMALGSPGNGPGHRGHSVQARMAAACCRRSPR